MPQDCGDLLGNQALLDQKGRQERGVMLVVVDHEDRLDHLASGAPLVKMDPQAYPDHLENRALQGRGV